MYLIIPGKEQALLEEGEASPKAGGRRRGCLTG